MTSFPARARWQGARVRRRASDGGVVVRWCPRGRQDTLCAVVVAGTGSDTGGHEGLRSA
jgi:hypothetical protein